MQLKLLIRDLGVLLIAGLVGAGIMYGFIQYQRMKNPENDTISSAKNADTILGTVGKLIELPKEIPTIATVSDITKLKGQAFFAPAKNGDKVLIYNIAKEAILYRPSNNKIIEVAPVNMENLPTPVMH